MSDEAFEAESLRVLHAIAEVVPDMSAENALALAERITVDGAPTDVRLRHVARTLDLRAGTLVEAVKALRTADQCRAPLKAYADYVREVRPE